MYKLGKQRLFKQFQCGHLIHSNIGVTSDMGAAECISALSMKFEPFLAIIQLFLPDFEKNPSLTQFAPQSRLGFLQTKFKGKTQLQICVFT